VKIAPVVNPVCTDAQIVGYVTQCLDPSLPDATACTAWKAVPENKACIDACPVVSNVAASPVTGNPPPTPAGPWGPLVRISNPGAIDFWNLGGCVATADPSPAGQSCGDALNAQLECEYTACAASCPIPLNPPDASLTVAAQSAFIECVFAADSTVCSTYVAAVEQCVAALPSSAPELFCVDAQLLSGDPSTFDPAAEKLLTTQCGGASGPDGGPDASDAGTD
jgi:hypothetical protein